MRFSRLERHIVEDVCREASSLGIVAPANFMLPVKSSSQREGRSGGSRSAS